jgi:hypothetical protein
VLADIGEAAYDLVVYVGENVLFLAVILVIFWLVILFGFAGGGA